MRPSFTFLFCLGACGPGVSVQPVPSPAPGTGADPVSFDVASVDLARGRIAVTSEVPLTVGAYLVGPAGPRFLGLTTDSLPTAPLVYSPGAAVVQSPFGATAGSQNTHFEGRHGSIARQVAGINRVCTTVGGDPDASSSSLRGRTLCSYSAGVPANLSVNPAAVPHPTDPPLTLVLVGGEGVIHASLFRAAAEKVVSGDPARVAVVLGGRVAGGDRWGAAVIRVDRHRPTR